MAVELRATGAAPAGPGEPVREGRLWIDGQWVESGRWEEGIDPCTGRVAYRYAVARPEDVARAVAAARRVQPAWAATPWPERRAVLRRAIRLLVERQEAIAATITLETGKPPVESVGGGEVPAALELLAFYAEETPRVLRPRRVRIPFPRPYLWGKQGVVERVPLGVVGCITPWNVPFSLALSAIVPALAAGNAVVCKPSEYAPLTVLEVARLFHDAGLPPGVLNVVPGGPETGQALVEADVDRIVFIGSNRVGFAIARRLAELGRRPPVLELGGKDPMIVCADADLDYAARGAVWNAFANGGQLCCSVERVYVVRPVAQAFLERVLREAERLTFDAGFRVEGDRWLAPRHNQTFMPLIRESARQKVHGHVEDALARGARLLWGGRIPEGPGFWYPPTVLADVTPEMRIMQEETFGPVLPVIVVDSEAEAVARANREGFMLSASVWTRDVERGRELARRLEAPMVLVNDHSANYLVADSPWGGSRGSGYGRIHGPEALYEVTEARPVWVDRVLAPKVWWYPYSPAIYDFLRAGNAFLFGGRLRDKLTTLPALTRVLLPALRQALPYLLRRR